MKMRLDRWLTTLGAGSRSEVKEWIRGGEAAVNGRIIRDPALSFDTEKDTPALRGKELDGRVTRHVLMYKPAVLNDFDGALQLTLLSRQAFDSDAKGRYS